MSQKLLAYFPFNLNGVTNEIGQTGLSCVIYIRKFWKFLVKILLDTVHNTIRVCEWTATIFKIHKKFYFKIFFSELISLRASFMFHGVREMFYFVQFAQHHSGCFAIFGFAFNYFIYFFSGGGGKK